MAILRDVTPLVEPIALDEAFLDVERRRAGCTARARRSRSSCGARIRADTGLVASVGVATTKFMAKLASDLAKPDGLLVVEPGTELDVLHPLAGRPAVGRRARDAPTARAHRCARRRRPRGDPGRDLLIERARARRTAGTCTQLAWNRDDRAVDPHRELKSVGHEETFPTDVHDRAVLEQELAAHGRACRRAPAPGRAGRAHGQLKLRYADFRTITRSRTLPEATDVAARDRDRRASSSCEAVDLGDGIRLLGMSVQQLEESVAVQSSSPLDVDAEDPGGVERARHRRPRPGRRDPSSGSVDEVRERDSASRAGGRASARAAYPPAASEDRGDDQDRDRRVRAHRYGALVRAAPADRRGPRRRPGHGHLRRRPASAADHVRGTTTREPLRIARRAPRATSTSCGSARGPPPTSRRSRPPSAAAGPCSARSRSRRPSRSPSSSPPARRGPAPGRPGAAARARVRAPWPTSSPRAGTAGRSPRSCATTSTSRSRVMYGSSWRADVANARAAGTLIEHSIHDVDVLRWILGDPVDVAARTTGPVRSCGHRRRRYAHPPVWRWRERDDRERLAPDPEPRVVAAPGGLLRGRPAVGRRRLPRAAPRPDERRRRAARSPAPPGGSTALTVPEVLAKPLAQYAEPSKAFLDALVRTAVTPRADPDAQVALAAHRIVDLAYRSAGGGGRPAGGSRVTHARTGARQ